MSLTTKCWYFPWKKRENTEVMEQRWFSFLSLCLFFKGTPRFLFKREFDWASKVVTPPSSSVFPGTGELCSHPAWGRGGCLPRDTCNCSFLKKLSQPEKIWKYISSSLRLAQPHSQALLGYPFFGFPSTNSQVSLSFVRMALALAVSS